MMTTKEIAELLSLLDDTKNLLKLVATAGDALDNGCYKRALRVMPRARRTWQFQ
jgi:hypothetical protein